MTNLAHTTPPDQTFSAITAEGATLPVIRAAGFEARVNAYIVGRTERVARAGPRQISGGELPITSRSPGCVGGATDLWYLSLVAPRGHGTTLRAIWANLVGNTHHAVWLEGVGMVALGQQRLDLSGPAGLGYALHWTYRQAVVAPRWDVQAVLESDLLTCYDPLLAPVVTRAPRAEHGKLVAQRSAAQARADRGATTLTSSASASGAQEDETRAREAHPLFLLLARSQSTGSRAFGASGDQANAALARLHLRFLAARIPWLPYYPTWADFLWRRALARGEAEPLHTWSYGASPGARSSAPARDGQPSGDEAQMTQDLPYLASAYLCRPDPLALTADLSQAIASGMFQSPVPKAVLTRPDIEAERAA
ncbi:MAG TPA: hypothetical protein VF739_12010 [Ktedonobacterales bacterium]